MSLRRAIVAALVVGVITLGLVYARRASNGSSALESRTPSARTDDSSQIPGLMDGDLIFQESTSRQSDMVHALTRSQWTHMGVVFHDNGVVVVLEAISPVKKTALAAWIARGREHRYVVKRLRDVSSRLTPKVIERMTKLGASWQGRPYDTKFRWSDEAFYCSELAHKLYDRAADIQLGQVVRAKTMNLDDPLVKRAIRERFTAVEFNPDEPVVTPDSIFNDPQLIEVRR